MHVSFSFIPLTVFEKKNFEYLYEPRCDKTGLRAFRARSVTNRAVQPQKIARGLKFRLYAVVESVLAKTKTLISLFSHCKKPGFS